jgi:hypothetical protein
VLKSMLSMASFMPLSGYGCLAPDRLLSMLGLGAHSIWRYVKPDRHTLAEVVDEVE